MRSRPVRALPPGFVRGTLITFACTALCLWIPQMVKGQDGRIIPTDSWVYEYASRLQRRGLLLELHPTRLPWKEGELRQALSRIDSGTVDAVAAEWVSLLQSEFPIREDDDADALFGVSLGPGIVAINSDRIDVLRPLDSGTSTIEVVDVRLFPNVAGTAYIGWNRFIAHLGLQHDVYYDTDPDGLDAVNRLYIRSEPTYVGYAGSFFSAYLGRFSNHWGISGQPAAVVSANPRSYDQISLQIGGDRLSAQSILGELDSISPEGQYTGRAFEEGSKRRYVASHRFDWRPSRYFNLAILESVLYSGQNTAATLKYLNPLHAFVFEVDNNPKNEENNGMIAGLLWLQVNRLTVHGQLLIDDFDTMGQSGEPGSFAVTGNLLYGGLLQYLDAGASLEVVAARTYNTHQAEGRYLYLQRGLATQFSDYVALGVFGDFYLSTLLPGLTLSPRLDLLWQGEFDIRDAYPGDEEDVDLILDGEVERTIRLAAVLRYQPHRSFWIKADLGPNLIQDRSGNSNTRFIGLLEVGIRITLERSFRASLR